MIKHISILFLFVYLSNARFVTLDRYKMLNAYIENIEINTCYVKLYTNENELLKGYLFNPTTLVTISDNIYNQIKTIEIDNNDNKIDKNQVNYTMCYKLINTYNDVFLNIINFENITFNCTFDYVPLIIYSNCMFVYINNDIQCYSKLSSIGNDVIMLIISSPYNRKNIKKGSIIRDNDYNVIGIVYEINILTFVDHFYTKTLYIFIHAPKYITSDKQEIIKCDEPKHKSVFKKLWNTVKSLFS